MKYLKKYEMWSDPTVTDNIEINYGDKKPELSDIIFEVIKYIKDHYDDISTDILNSTTEFQVGFRFPSKSGMKYDRIGIEEYKNQKHLHFYYSDANGQRCGYTIAITEDEYEYLHKYFLKIHNEFRKKEQEKNIETHLAELTKIEEEKIKNTGNKYNL
jgi:hypothetical protein